MTQEENTIQKTTEGGNVIGETGEQQISHETTLFAEPIYHLGSFTITNALFTSWFAVMILVIIAFVLRLKLREIPKGIQNVFEMIIDGALSFCDQVTNNRKLSLKILPIALSVFLFILINNWLGLLPLGGFGLLEAGEEGGFAFVPIFRGGTADINTTLGLAVMAVISANLFGAFSIGFWKTFNKYVNLKALGEIGKKIKTDPTIILVAPVTFLVGLFEIIGEFAKMASLSFRLFGNVFAGEVLLASIATLVAYIVPLPFMLLEIFVGVIQAFIFAILLTVYFTIGASDHDHEEEHKNIHLDKDFLNKSKENNEVVIINN
jgi:F-type H+-transporting ATPase subunit a